MLVESLLATNERVPRHEAVADAARSLTYTRLTQLSTVLRGVVDRETSCERVGVMLPASSIFPAALYGTLWASRVVVPLNFLAAPEKLQDVVEDAALDLILTVTHFRKLVEPLPARAIYLDELPLKRSVLLSLLKRLPGVPTTATDDTAVILYTSGTTAEPKGVELSHGNLTSNVIDTIDALDIDQNQQIVNVLPPFHVFGLTANVLMPVVLGATVFAIPRFSAMAILKAIEKRGVTMLIAIPSMYAAMLRAKSGSREAFSTVSLAVSGGEPLPESIRTSFEERFGVSIWQGYGLTETSPVVSLGSHACHMDGTVGKTIPNVEVRIVDDERRQCAIGTAGGILVRSPGVMKGYYCRPEATKEVIDPDGWFDTGDVGSVDSDGFLRITGRAKEMLIVGGENVFPREIECVLERHESVLQAAVVGVADELRGEAPVAFVLTEEGAEVSERELRTFAKKSLASFMVPKRICVKQDLPVSATGKILKRSLKDLL